MSDMFNSILNAKGKEAEQNQISIIYNNTHK